MVECTEPYPVCPHCGCGTPLPPFAQPHHCDISCRCGTEFSFERQCGRLAGQGLIVHEPGPDPVWRMGAACWPHARVVLKHRGDVLLVGFS